VNSEAGFGLNQVLREAEDAAPVESVGQTSTASSASAFPKGTDLSVHTGKHLNAVAAELNNRPRKMLGWETPAERLSTLLTAQQSRSSAFRRHTAEQRQGER